MKKCPVCKNNLSQNEKICSKCGNLLVDEALPAGTRISTKYTVGKILGQGGFGITYKGSDTLLKKRVAIKEFFMAGSSRNGNTVIRPITQNEAEYLVEKEKILREAQTISNIDNRHIVKIFDYVDENNTAYMIMEYLDGKTVGALIKENGEFRETDCINIILQLIEGLQEIHNQNLLHRDIKPENIMIVNNVVKLIDFGAATVFKIDEDNEVSRLLTPGYAPLEQYTGNGSFGPSLDIYAIGATMHKMLLLTKPPEATDRKQNNLMLKDLEDSRLTNSLKRIIRKCLELDQNNRFQTLDDLKKHLLSIIEDTEKTIAKSKQGELNITTTPDRIPVYIDDKYVGNTPLRKRVDSGTHSITFKESKKYKSFLKNIHVGEKENKKVEVKLQRKRKKSVLILSLFFIITAIALGVIIQKKDVGKLVVNSNPEGASIYLDKFVGITPLVDIELKSGNYEMKIEKKGFETKYIPLNVESGKTIEKMIFLEPRPVTGTKKCTINIFTKPDNAVIKLDGIYKGTSPLIMDVDLNNSYEIEVSKEEYEADSVILSVDNQRSLTKQIVLEEIRPTGKIHITTNPSHADVRIKGVGEKLSPAQFVDLDVGNYELEISMEGYETKKLSISLEKNQVINKEVRLKKKTGDIEITTVPDNSSIKVDRDYLGTSPIVIEDIEIGKHTVEIIKDGYKEKVINIFIEKDEVLKEKIILESLFGFINIKTIPSHAEIKFDGNQIGTSPIRINNVEVGNHIVEITKEGFYDEHREIDMEYPMEINKTITLLPIPKTGKLIIITDPKGMDISIDEVKKWASPLVIDLTASKLYEIKVSKEGFYEKEETVFIEKGGTVKLNYTMERISDNFTVTFESSPTGAEVYLSRVRFGKTPFSFELNPGEYISRFVKVGYQEEIYEFKHKPGTNTEIFVELKPKIK